MTYTVVLKETIVHTCMIVAKNEEDAEEQFKKMLGDGVFDYSGGELVDSEIEVKEERS